MSDHDARIGALVRLLLAEVAAANAEQASPAPVIALPSRAKKQRRVRLRPPTAEKAPADDLTRRQVDEFLARQPRVVRR